MTLRSGRLALALLAPLLTLACSRAPKTSADALAPGTVPTPRQFGLEDTVPLDSVSISIERQPCYGFCPTYRMTIDGRGRVVYKGERFVGTTGEQRGTMPVDDFVTLVDEFLRLRIFELPNEYASRKAAQRDGDRIHIMEMMSSDAPTTILTLNLGARTKSTRLYSDYPIELGALADSIDSKSGALRWISGYKPGPKYESNETR